MNMMKKILNEYDEKNFDSRQMFNQNWKSKNKWCDEKCKKKNRVVINEIRWREVNEIK